MGKTLGLDLGTNSIGWAIVERDDERQTLVKQGVCIFQEGVLRGKNGEKPTVQDRTEARALRRHYFRRRLRKIELLKVLIDNNLCPYVAAEELDRWKQHKVYPKNEDFIRWQRTSDEHDKNPYHDRFRALNERLNLDSLQDRYTLGRALYHLGQRRGFLSNRKDSSDNKEDGTVQDSIKSLTDAMKKAGCRYLGEYFYRIYGIEHIRRRYTARNIHYLTEFDAICEKQCLPDSLKKALHRAIFYQRPLKSQKGQVGKCTFEPRKSRCPVSHPRFEEFRMLQFVNNIRVKTSCDEDFRPLNQNEFVKIEGLFYRKSKPHFNFEEIAQKIAGKGKFACKGNNADLPYKFNFSANTTVSGCPVTAQLRNIFGEDYLSEICSVYVKGENKSPEQILNDIWHVLFSFDDADLLSRWARLNLQLPEKDADEFAKIGLKQDYAALSLNAINKILPYLRLGHRYDAAVFLANLDKVLPDEIRNNAQQAEMIRSTILAELRQNEDSGHRTQENIVTSYLSDIAGVTPKRLGHLYHPSKIEKYPAAHTDSDGKIRLGSPRISAIRNPMAMRALFRMRALVNHLLDSGDIDTGTKINIEFARGLNDANKRKAIENYQRKRERQRAEYKSKIVELYKKETGMDITPSDTDVLKYQLWEEQEHICPYTGKTIPMRDFIGSHTSFDIEHTVPRSLGGDDSQMNKTLCENFFNRYVKRGQLPVSLANHSEIMERLESFKWKDKIDTLEKQISRLSISIRSASTKSEKDSAIQRKHELKMELDYWKGKLSRFTMREVPEGFSNRQGVDIGIIGRYARLYLKTVFDKIYIVKGATTAEFRVMWGLQDAYSKKERVNHVHHCIDAITIACIGAREYAEWARYVKADEDFCRGTGDRPSFTKPWPTFTEDVKGIADRILVSHNTPDNMAKRGRKLLRVRGKIRTDAKGRPIYVQGDTARAVLHQQTFYGAIKQGEEIKYVIRKSLDQLEKSDLENIIDPVVRQKVQVAVDMYGERVLKDPEHIIWMNEQKRVPIRKVRLYAGSITRPIHLKKQRDLSDKSYKQDYHVANDSNYCMGIYEGVDVKGKIKRNFRIVNNLEAARYFNNRSKGVDCELVPLSDSNDYPLKYVLKTGTMVLFYEKSPEELYIASPAELVKRLYKTVGMSIQIVEQKYRYGIMVFKHNQEARSSGDLKIKKGVWKTGEEYRPLLSLNHNQFMALVEGYDFELTVAGDIRFKNH